MLTLSMTELESERIEIHAKRRKHDTAAKLASFSSGQRQRVRCTQAVEVATSGVGRSDYAKDGSGQGGTSIAASPRYQRDRR